MKAKRQVLTFKVNSGAYGADPAPTATANVLLAQNVDISPLEMETDDYAPVSNTFGTFEKIVGAVWSSVGFEVMLGGGGTPVGQASTLPNCDPVLRACAMAYVITPGVQSVYSPVDTGEEDAGMYHYVDGILQKVLGLRGNFEITLAAKKAAMLKFNGLGLNVPMTDLALPTPTLPTPPRPLATNKANTAALLNSAYAVKLSALSINLGNDVQYRNLCNREDVVVVDRNMSGKITLELPLVAERDFLGANGWCTKATPVSLYVAQGTDPGTIFNLHLPQVQLFNPKPRTEAGILMLECDLHIVRNQFYMGFY